ncbi:DUF5686 and carboxypeptidase regulatory-like domain-containing protein [Mucilaginibacter antarcticus]|uniref:DUF5686 and carboxypeptidase regulatory-like domain-containing protein n=1 Tax=Mucilaginibacter antarcticus TaxID=1855725 RepID=A0ABW5XS36_9SPHI
MRSTLSLIFVLLINSSLFAQLTISGKITDDAGKSVPFAAVYIKNTTQGASANSEGEYSLSLKPGQHLVQYKAVGYKQESRTVDLKQNKVVNVTLSTEVYQLQTVNVGGVDPAYAIIRKAIKKRKTYLNEVKAFTADIYIKGMQKLLDAPKKFLGRDINEMAKEMGLDSNRRGIIYLSESESKYSYQYPDKVHEVMVSSKVSGSNRAFSYNRATDMRVIFYENLQQWGRISLRPLISPIADNALFYYNYRWIGETTENGKTVNKIKVMPRREHDPCFEGYIYIQEDSWRLVGLNLYVTKKANINLVDTIRINQQFVPVDNKAWLTSNIRFDFNGGLFGFKFGGYFISVYKNYDLNPTFNKKDFNEVLRITKGVNKKDSTYWEQERPIPLTDEEKADYQKKDSIATKRESKGYMDSVDRINNKFSIRKLLIGGINRNNRYKKQYFHIDPILSRAIQFNTVQGVNIDWKASYTKLIDTVDNRYFRLGSTLGYGFSNHLFNAVIDATLPVNKFTLHLSGGSDVLDMNNLQPISPFANTLHSLLAKENFQKFYQKQFASVLIGGRISGGLRASVDAEFASRTWLDNTSAFSFNGRKQYTSNNPFVPYANVPLFAKNQSLKITGRLSYDFSNKYATYPTGRRFLPSKYPTIGFAYTKGIKNVFGSDVDFDKISADISKTNIRMGLYGRSAFYIGAGKFINSNSIYYTDYNHFYGSQALLYRGGINSFLLLNYYLYSSRTEYLEGHFQHNFSGFFTNKIPLIRKLKLQEIVHVNYLTSPELKNYYELGFGVQYFRFKLLYGRSYNSANNAHDGIRLAIGL